ncbi:hypothetical protein BC830DRAFT_1143169 [Chytriomyces sp. MP71]|nr:hypothetical protein BC830DRAFT_1143169 [Chytriomyces sp. MP71]
MLSFLLSSCGVGAVVTVPSSPLSLAHLSIASTAMFSEKFSSSSSSSHRFRFSSEMNPSRSSVSTRVAHESSNSLVAAAGRGRQGGEGQESGAGREISARGASEGIGPCLRVLFVCGACWGGKKCVVKVGGKKPRCLLLTQNQTPEPNSPFNPNIGVFTNTYALLLLGRDWRDVRGFVLLLQRRSGQLVAVPPGPRDTK